MKNARKLTPEPKSASVSLGKPEASDPFSEDELIENLYAVRDSKGKWVLDSSEASGLWKMVLTEEWKGQIEAPRYAEFFKYLLAALDKANHSPAQVKAHVTYRHGYYPEADLAKYMDDWAKNWRTGKLIEMKGMAVAVSERTDKMISTCRLLINEYEVLPIVEDVLTSDIHD